MKFLRPYERIRKPAPSGSGVRTDWQLIIGDDGKYQLVKVGETDVYAKIQSHRQSVEIYSLLELYNKTGDESVLNGRPAVYADVTEIPQSRIDADNLITGANQLYNNLPAAKKKQFDSFNSFLAAIASGDLSVFVTDKVTESASSSPSSGEITPDEVEIKGIKYAKVT